MLLIQVHKCGSHRPCMEASYDYPITWPCYDQTQVISFGSECLYLLRHFTSPQNLLFSKLFFTLVVSSLQWSLSILRRQIIIIYLKMWAVVLFVCFPVIVIYVINLPSHTSLKKHFKMIKMQWKKLEGLFL